MRKNSVRWAKKQWEITERLARELALERAAYDAAAASMEAALLGDSFIQAGLLDGNDKEVSYTQYARVNMARTSENFKVQQGEVEGRIAFPVCTGGSALVEKLQLWLGGVEVARAVFQPMRISAGIAPLIDFKIKL